MKEETVEAASLEPERYELQAEVQQHWDKARLEFFDAVGGGVVVVYALDQVPAVQESSGRRGGPGLSLPQEIGFWLHIGGDGKVTGYTGKVEVGQNIRTALTQIIADELPLPLEAIRLVMADTHLSPFDGGTTGSRTSPVTAPQVRRTAAAAREILLDLAARQENVERSAVSFKNGKIIVRGTLREISAGALVAEQKLLDSVGDEASAKLPEEWKTSERSVEHVNGHALVTGEHRYTSDLKRPGMLYGKVLRAPAVNARRVSLDTRAAEALSGVIVVRENEFVGIAARDPVTAQRALEAIRAEWSVAEGQPSRQDVFDYFKKTPQAVSGYGRPSVHTAGSLPDGLKAAVKVLESSYTVDYIAHAPLETRAAIAEWSDEREKSCLTVWTGTQRPFGVRGELAEAFGISEGQVRVIVPDTGSGYGGKHTGEAAIEAARLARAAGQPVKLVWTREEEFANAYFRPAGVIDIRSGIDANGMITSWEFHNYNSGSSAIRTDYRVPNQHIEFHAAHSPLRQGSYRALAATANHFARETHMDELASAAQMDPLAFRLNNLDDPRLRDVLQSAADRFGWGSTKQEANHGFGIAGGHEKGSYVATCAEVAVDPGRAEVRVIRTVTAFECGAIINEDNVRNQVDGAVIMGLGGALFESIDFGNGRISNGAFSRYRVPRFGDVPILDTVLLDRKDLPSVGAGETPIVAIAPAVGNAVFNATGLRRRSLPLTSVETKREA